MVLNGTYHDSLCRDLRAREFMDNPSASCGQSCNSCGLGRLGERSICVSGAITINVAMHLQASATKNDCAVEQRLNTGRRACARPLESLNLYSGLSNVRLNVLASNGIRQGVRSRGQCSCTAEAWRWYGVPSCEQRSSVTSAQSFK